MIKGDNMIDDLDIDLIGEEEVQEPIEDNEIIEDSKTIVEEPEPTKDDILLKFSPVKAATTNEITYNANAFNARWIQYRVTVGTNDCYYNVDNIPLGTKYYLTKGSNRLPRDGSYLIRGKETVSPGGGSPPYLRNFVYSLEMPSMNTNAQNQLLNVVIVEESSNNDLTEIQNQLDVMESAVDYIYDNVYLNQMKIDNNNSLLWEVNDYVQGIPNNPVFVRVFGKPDNNSQAGGVGMVSQNIMTTPINEYGLSDSMSLIFLLMAVAGLIVYIIHKTIFKWGK